MKADKKAVIAAATENLKSLNTLVEERESEDLKEADLVRDSIQSFSKPFSTHRIDEEDHESGRDSPPAIEYTLPPRRASIRIPSHPPDGIPQRRSSVAKASLSQTTPLTASELKRGSRNSTIVPFNSAADDEHAMYATTSAHAAQETVEAMSSLLGDSYQPQEVTSPEEGYSQEYQYQEDHYQNYGNGNDYHDPNYYDQYNQYYDQG